MTETDLSLYAVGTLTDEEAREAVAWRYDGEYAVYNFPSWDECAARGWSITDAVKRENAYFSVRYAGEFLGFFHIMDRAGHVELGVGMKPELCGQGRGRMLMALALAKILETRGCTTVMLAVRTFNTRVPGSRSSTRVMKLSAPRPEKCTSCRPQFDLSQTSSPSLGSLMRGGLFLFMHKINKK